MSLEELAHLQCGQNIGLSPVWTKPFAQPMNTSSNVHRTTLVGCLGKYNLFGSIFFLFHFFIFYPSKHFQIVEVSPLGTAKTANSTSYIQSHHHRIHGKIQKHGCYFHLFLSSSIPICNSSTTHIARYFSSSNSSSLCRPKFLNLTPLAIFMAAKCQILLIFFIFLDYNYNVFSG